MAIEEADTCKACNSKAESVRCFMADKIQIRKGIVEDTLIVPLYGWKLCVEQFPTLYQDPYATKICERLNYDFSQLQGKEKSVLYQYGAL
ncbi:hypothetical protein AXF17_02660 [Mogibacterium pumilum]|uniref:Uncharacterized protein n=2 Tax=Mogibacterium pumilum TaxID=86332 RepID=A0A223AR84_9FIRM|nr:hypothetical protein AXF17_02660 [Mogibacterium pumilum]